MELLVRNLVTAKLYVAILLIGLIHNKLGLGVVNLLLRGAMFSFFQLLDEGFLVFNDQLVDLDVALDCSNVAIHCGVGGICERRKHLLTHVRLRSYSHLTVVLLLHLLLVIGMLIVTTFVILGFRSEIVKLLHLAKHVDHSGSKEPA